MYYYGYNGGYANGNGMYYNNYPGYYNNGYGYGAADVYFPMFDESVWIKTVLSENEENGLKYKHVLYEKKTL